MIQRLNENYVSGTPLSAKSLNKIVNKLNEISGTSKLDLSFENGQTLCAEDLNAIRDKINELIDQINSQTDDVYGIKVIKYSTNQFDSDGGTYSIKAYVTKNGKYYSDDVTINSTLENDGENFIIPQSDTDTDYGIEITSPYGNKTISISQTGGDADEEKEDTYSLYVSEFPSTVSTDGGTVTIVTSIQKNGVNNTSKGIQVNLNYPQGVTSSYKDNGVIRTYTITFPKNEAFNSKVLSGTISAGTIGSKNVSISQGATAPTQTIEVYANGGGNVAWDTDSVTFSFYAMVNGQSVTSGVTPEIVTNEVGATLVNTINGTATYSITKNTGTTNRNLVVRAKYQNKYSNNITFIQRVNTGSSSNIHYQVSTVIFNYSTSQPSQMVGAPFLGSNTLVFDSNGEIKSIEGGLNFIDTGASTSIKSGTTAYSVDGSSTTYTTLGTGYLKNITDEDEHTFNVYLSIKEGYYLAGVCNNIGDEGKVTVSNWDFDKANGKLTFTTKYNPNGTSIYGENLNCTITFLILRPGSATYYDIYYDTGLGDLEDPYPADASHTLYSDTYFELYRDPFTSNVLWAEFLANRNIKDIYSKLKQASLEHGFDRSKYIPRFGRVGGQHYITPEENMYIKVTWDGPYSAIHQIELIGTNGTFIDPNFDGKVIKLEEGHTFEIQDEGTFQLDVIINQDYTLKDVQFDELQADLTTYEQLGTSNTYRIKATNIKSSGTITVIASKELKCNVTFIYDTTQSGDTKIISMQQIDEVIPSKTIQGQVKNTNTVNDWYSGLSTSINGNQGSSILGYGSFYGLNDQTEITNSQTRTYKLIIDNKYKFTNAYCKGVYNIQMTEEEKTNLNSHMSYKISSDGTVIDITISDISANDIKYDGSNRTLVNDWFQFDVVIEYQSAIPNDCILKLSYDTLDWPIRDEEVILGMTGETFLVYARRYEDGSPAADMSLSKAPIITIVGDGEYMLTQKSVDVNGHDYVYEYEVNNDLYENAHFTISAEFDGLAGANTLDLKQGTSGGNLCYCILTTDKGEEYISKLEYWSSGTGVGSTNRMDVRGIDYHAGSYELTYKFVMYKDGEKIPTTGLKLASIRQYGNYAKEDNWYTCSTQPEGGPGHPDGSVTSIGEDTYKISMTFTESPEVYWRATDLELQVYFSDGSYQYIDSYVYQFPYIYLRAHTDYSRSWQQLIYGEYGVNPITCEGGYPIEEWDPGYSENIYLDCYKYDNDINSYLEGSYTQITSTDKGTPRVRLLDKNSPTYQQDGLEYEPVEVEKLEESEYTSYAKTYYLTLKPNHSGKQKIVVYFADLVDSNGNIVYTSEDDYRYDWEIQFQESC